ncbi:hypothetical protein BST95_13740 [Halioglobus japonicus]|nr:hypothetical protein BST95_13740 [Halioglobus japonicus]
MRSRRRRRNRCECLWQCRARHRIYRGAAGARPRGLCRLCQTGKRAVSIPVIGVGRIEPENADRHIAEGDFDFLAMGRKLLADPDLPNKLVGNHAGAIRPCIYCYSCVSQIFINQPMMCAVNSSTGREHEGDILASTARPQRVLVIGGGPGGMEAARILTERGHQVALWEKDKDLVGTARIAALAYEPNGRLIQYLQQEMRRLPIALETGKQASAVTIAQYRADHVIVATGALRRAPDITGKEQRHVFDVDELRGILLGTDTRAAAKLSPLARMAVSIARFSQALRSIKLLRFASRIWMPIADEVVIIGGGLVGLELAEFLVERGRKITVIEPGTALGAELAIVRRARVLHELREHGVRTLNRAAVKEIRSDAVVYAHKGELQDVPAKQVIIAMGAEGDASMTDQLVDLPATIHRVGDCRDVGYIDGAIADARRISQLI